MYIIIFVLHWFGVDASLSSVFTRRVDDEKAFVKKSGVDVQFFVRLSTLCLCTSSIMTFVKSTVRWREVLGKLQGTEVTENFHFYSTCMLQLLDYGKS